MDNNFDNKSGYNPYGYVNQLDEFRRIQQENAMLKQQMRQQQFTDPIYGEWQQSAEYQEAKKNNVLTFLLFKFFGEWQQSEIGKQFTEWEKTGFEKFRSQKGAKPKSDIDNNKFI